MTIRTALRTLAAAALVAAGLGVGAAHAEQPAPDTQPTIVTEGQTRITTDKAVYAVGEPITISYTLPGRGYIRITDHQGSQVSTLRSGYSAKATGTIKGTVSPPYGKECLTLAYAPYRTPTRVPIERMLIEEPSGQPGPGPAFAETCFEVKEPKKVDVLGGEA